MMKRERGEREGEEMESTVAGQGWICGVKKCVAVERGKTDGRSKKEEKQKRSGWGQRANG